MWQQEQSVERKKLEHVTRTICGQTKTGKSDNKKDLWKGNITNSYFIVTVYTYIYQDYEYLSLPVGDTFTKNMNTYLCQ